MVLGTINAFSAVVRRAFLTSNVVVFMKSTRPATDRIAIGYQEPAHLPAASLTTQRAQTVHPGVDFPGIAFDTSSANDCL